MQTVKFLCEFFFTNFWHWLGLLVIIMAIFKLPISVKLNNQEKK